MASRVCSARSYTWTVATAMLVCLAAVPGPASAQQRGTTASIAVSVTVVRSCSVSSPDSVAPAAPTAATVRLSCATGKQATVPVSTLGATPIPTSVPGAPATPSLSTARKAGELLLAIDF